MTVPVCRWRCSQRVGTLNGAILCDHCSGQIDSYKPAKQLWAWVSASCAIGWAGE